MNRLPSVFNTSFAFLLLLCSYTRSIPAQGQISDASRSALSPVYAPLAEWITDRFDLSGKEGVGIDIGGGPGDLAVALSERTPRLRWINADIDPTVQTRVMEKAARAGVADRVSVMIADVHALPFRENFADVIVSRGSFQQWKDLRRGLGEIYRVLKPGGTAFIGRGFSPNLPPDIARQVRDRQRGGGFEPAYDLGKTSSEFAAIMRDLRITDFEIHIPRPAGSEGILYGIWLEFHKGDRVAGARRTDSSASPVSAERSDSFPVMEPVEVSAHRIRDPLAEPLAEADHRLGQQVLVERAAALALDGLAAGADQRVVGHREGQPRQHQQLAGRARQVNALPEAAGAEDHQPRLGDRALHQLRRVSVHALGR
jgi:SAM-dependent methyltransferase